MITSFLLAFFPLYFGHAEFLTKLRLLVFVFYFLYVFGKYKLLILPWKNINYAITAVDTVENISRRF